MEKIDQFLEYLYTIDENTTELTTLQVQKLEVIKDKVAEIVKRLKPVQPLSDSVALNISMQQSQFK